jgi:hypothetical protein
MIAWGALGTEFVVSLVAAVGVVVIFALGLRLLAVGAPVGLRQGDAGDAGDGAGDGDVAVVYQRPAWASAAAYVCFAVAVAAVLYGLYLIIPRFH